MTCGGCKNAEASFVKAGFFKGESGKREFYEYCDKCGGAGPVHIPDVFWDGKPEENLADGPDGKPVVFFSKGQKARYLQERGIYEAGDTHHGAPVTSLVSESREERRRRNLDAVRSARMKVESMGKIYRRQEFLRLTKGKRA